MDGRGEQNRQDGGALGLRRFCCVLRTDIAGTALIEFALVLPVALLMCFGSIQLHEGIACSRKVSIATRAIADLAARSVSGSIGAAELDTILAATTQIMAPFSATGATIRISQLETDGAGKTSVLWSRARNGQSYQKDMIMVLPAGMRLPGSNYLLAEISYAYRPRGPLETIGTFALNDKLYMLPRNAAKLECVGC